MKNSKASSEIKSNESDEIESITKTDSSEKPNDSEDEDSLLSEEENSNNASVEDGFSWDSYTQVDWKYYAGKLDKLEELRRDALGKIKDEYSSINFILKTNEEIEEIYSNYIRSMAQESRCSGGEFNSLYKEVAEEIKKLDECREIRRRVKNQGITFKEINECLTFKRMPQCLMPVRLGKSQRINIAFSLISAIFLALLTAGKSAVILATDQNSTASMSLEIANTFFTAVVSAINAYLGARFIENANHDNSQQELLGLTKQERNASDIEAVGIVQPPASMRWLAYRLNKIEIEHQEELAKIPKQPFGKYMFLFRQENTNFARRRNVIYRYWVDTKTANKKSKEVRWYSKDWKALWCNEKFIKIPQCCEGRWADNQRINVGLSLVSSLLLAVAAAVKSAVILATDQNSTLAFVASIIDMSVTFLAITVSLFLTGRFFTNANDVYRKNDLIDFEIQKTRDKANLERRLNGRLTLEEEKQPESGEDNALAVVQGTVRTLFSKISGKSKEVSKSESGVESGPLIKSLTAEEEDRELHYNMLIARQEHIAAMAKRL